MRYGIIFFILLGFLAGCSDNDPVSSGGVTSGLVGYWPMDDEEGDTARDYSGNNNHLGNSLVPPVWHPDPRTGTAVEFNGTTSYLERADSVLSLNFPGKGGGATGSITVTAWILPRSRSYQMIAAKDQFDGRSFNFSVTGAGNLGVQIFTAEAADDDFNGDSLITLDIWNHVAMVYSYLGDTNSVISTYVNGALDRSEAGVLGPVNGTATPFRVGSRSYSGQWNFDGLIDEVRIYNRALNAAEILAVSGL